MKQIDLLKALVKNMESHVDFLHGLDMSLFTRKKGNILTIGDVVDGYELVEPLPETHIVNGIEVPAPMREKPEQDQKYFYPCIADEDLIDIGFWGDGFTDNIIFNNNVCFKTADDAEKNAKALFGEIL